MPFDNSNHIGFERYAVSSLLKQADQAFDACDRAGCIERVEEIYALFDAISAARPPAIASAWCPSGLAGVLGASTDRAV